MKKTAVTAAFLSLIMILGTSAAAHSAQSIAESSRATVAAPSDYVPEPQEEIITDYFIPEGQQGFGDVKNLEYHFHENGWPEYLSYISAYDKGMTEDGSMALMYRAGLTELSDENKAEILALADSSCYIVFEQAQYSYAQRLSVYEMLRDELPEAYVSLGYDCEAIVVYAPEGRLDDCVQHIGGRFGGLVFVADTDGTLYDGNGVPTGEKVIPFETGIGDAGGYVTGGNVQILTEPDNSGMTLAAAIAAVMLLVVGAAVLLARSRVRVSAEGTAAAAATLTKKDVVRMIAQSNVSPSNELRERILK